VFAAAMPKQHPPKRRKKEKPLEWIKSTLDLAPNHGWEATEGYQVFVAGRGAVRFEVPSGWHFEPKEKSFRFLDQAPPDDECGLEVSYNVFAKGVNWKDLPLTPIVRKVMQEDTRDLIEVGEVIPLKRQTAKIVWGELKFMDHQEEDREAFSRICVGIGSGIQCLITFEFWADEIDRCIPIWDHVLETLVLGLYIPDPRTGFARPD
jgi:hypothetical protein